MLRGGIDRPGPVGLLLVGVGMRSPSFLSRRIVATLLSLIIGAGCDPETAPPDDRTDAAPLMTPGELDGIPSGPADDRIAYGTDPSHHGELRVPEGDGPHPVAVLIHGGCFKAEYATLRDLAAMGEALKEMGIATWNLEYRRLGEPGGGWPGTYLDVGRGVDHLRSIADEHALDLSRVVLVGHSAGGHLAMWAAARHRVQAGSDVHSVNPLPVRGVLDLAGPVDLTANIAGYEGLCRDTVITALMGGTPTAVPERYAEASPMRLLPLGIPQVLLISSASTRRSCLARSTKRTYAPPRSLATRRV